MNSTTQKANTIFIGIDPGKNGGLAWILNTNGSLIAGCVKMPQTERDINDTIKELSFKAESTFCFLEKVASRPGQGAPGMFKFGMGYGALRAFLTAHRIPFEDVTPQKWMGALTLKKKNKEESGTSHKNRIKGRAQQLFPNIKVTLATSDALMIAYYCKQENY